jgi:hypothetical protein
MPARTRISAVFSVPSLGDLVSRAESDAANIASQPIGVFRDQLDSIVGTSRAVRIYKTYGAGPIPVTSRKRGDSCSMMSNTASPSAHECFFA